MKVSGIYMKNQKFSVLMSVYSREKPQYLRMAFDSIFNQSLMATEVVLVEDGKLTIELDNVISEYENKYSNLKVLRYECNRGLGKALNDGLAQCSYDLVLRMDTDDICRKDRFEIQINYMTEHPEIDVLGTNIFEFKDNINENMRIKKMPQGSIINSYILKRNPLNHMTVCFRKKAVLECGGYKELLYLEDYYLWVRMFLANKKIENINDELVYARIGNGFEKRRGNKKQIIGWKKLQKYMLANNMLNKKNYYINIIRMYLMVYSPTSIRVLAYKYLLRK